MKMAIFSSLFFSQIIEYSFDSHSYIVIRTGQNDMSHLKLAPLGFIDYQLVPLDEFMPNFMSLHWSFMFVP